MKSPTTALIFNMDALFSAVAKAGGLQSAVDPDGLQPIVAFAYELQLGGRVVFLVN